MNTTNIFQHSEAFNKFILKRFKNPAGKDYADSGKDIWKGKYPKKTSVERSKGNQPK